MLELFSFIEDKSYHLIIAGNKGWGPAAKEINIILQSEGYPKERVFFTGFVSSDDLIRLYKHAFLFISTSHNEGFGLPQLEAMACGCPVITSDNSAMTEVVGEAGIKIKSWDIKDWLAAINLMELNRDDYINLGYNRVASYRWEKIIKLFVNILE